MFRQLPCKDIINKIDLKAKHDTVGYEWFQSRDIHGIVQLRREHVFVYLMLFFLLRRHKF